MAVKSGLVRQLFKWLGIGLAVVLVGIPLVFALVFLGIQEATERQWLGKAPESEAIAARSKAPHRVALLDVGFDSLAERLRLIESAQKSIELEFFIYQIDTSSRLLTQALARKAQQGVQVRMLVDFAMPVFKLAPQYVKTLEAAGVQVRYYNTAGIQRIFAAQHRTHRKLLVADRDRAIVGGRNIGDEYFDLSPHYNFLDSDLALQGPIAGAITDSFDLYWNSAWVTHPNTLPDSAPATQDLLAELSLTETELSRELAQHQSDLRSSTCNDMEFITDYPGSGVERRKVFTAVSKLALEAQREITVETPYLVLLDDGVDVVRSVLARGVQLRFLTNSLHSTDAFYTVSHLASHLEQLQLPGLQAWAYQGAGIHHRPGSSQRWGVHAKRAVFDEDTVIVGTYNIDPRSANLNSELIVICRGNPDLASAMKVSMQTRIANSKAVIGGPSPGGMEALMGDADAASLRLMRLTAPLSDWLDFLL